jgi:enolase
MSNLEKTFERYVAAERQLSDEAAPLLGAIIRGVAARCGVRISEFRVTVDWAKSVDGAIAANCTIVHALENDHSVQSKSTDGAAESART